MDSMQLENIKGQIASRLSSGVRLGRDQTIGFGIYTPEGRQIGAQIVSVWGDHVVITDGGESWSDLWSDGTVAARPTDMIKTKLDQLCRSYRVEWDAEANAITCLSHKSSVVDAALRLAACSLAIDGWRLMISAKQRGGFRSEEIMRGVESVAMERGWDYASSASVQGKLRVWKPNARLARDGAQVAVSILEETKPESAIQRVFGWIGDTDAKVVFVTSLDVANNVEQEVKAIPRVAIVAKTGNQTPSSIVDAADRIAA